MNKTLFAKLIRTCATSETFDFDRVDQCVVPHALDLFKIKSIPHDHQNFGEAIRAVAAKLEMPYEDAYQLFYPHEAFETFLTPEQDEVIEALEHYMNTGEIVWDDTSKED